MEYLEHIHRVILQSLFQGLHLLDLFFDPLDPKV